MINLKLSGHMRDILQGASIAAALKIISAGLVLGYNILLARLLGAQGVGIYYLALMVTTVASVIGRVGLDYTLLRFTATNATKENWIQVAGLYRKAMLMATGASLALALILFLGAESIATVIFRKPTLSLPLRVMALGIPLMSLMILHGELLKGLKKIGQATFVGGVGVPLFGLPLLAILGPGLGIQGAALAYISANFLVLLVGIVLWRRATPQLREINGTFDTNLILQTSLHLLWAALMTFVLNWVDIIMLGIWADSSELGIYAAALRLARTLTFFMLAISAIAAPKFATLYAQGDKEGLRLVSQGAARLILILGLPLGFIFISFPARVLGIFGPEFVAGAPVLIILSFGFLVRLSAGLWAYLLIMTGNQKTVSKITTLSALIAIGLSYFLIPRYGKLGAGMATSITLALNSAMAVYAVKKILGFMPTFIPYNGRKTAQLK